MQNQNKIKIAIAKEILVNFKLFFIALTMSVAIYSILYISTTPDYFTHEEIAEETLKIKQERNRAIYPENPTSSVTGFSMRKSKYMNSGGLVAGMSMEDRNRMAEIHFMSDIKDISIKAFPILLGIFILGRYIIIVLMWANTTSKENKSPNSD